MAALATGALLAASNLLRGAAPAGKHGSATGTFLRNSDHNRDKDAMRRIDNRLRTKGFNQSRQRQSLKPGHAPDGASGRFETKMTPASESVVTSGFNLRMGGTAQRKVDYESSSLFPIRITGSDTFVTISTGASGSAGPPFQSGTLGGVTISPAGLSVRLQNFLRNYCFYAFRELKFRYIPYCGSSTGGGFAMAMSSDSGLLNTTSLNTTGEVMQLEVASMAPIWSPQTVVYKYDGPHLWSTDYKWQVGGAAATAPTAWYTQGTFTGWSIGLANSTSFGEVVVSYVVDAYCPSLSHDNPSVPRALIQWHGPQVEKTECKTVVRHAAPGLLDAEKAPRPPAEVQEKKGEVSHMLVEEYVSVPPSSGQTPVARPVPDQPAVPLMRGAGPPQLLLRR